MRNIIDTFIVLLTILCQLLCIFAKNTWWKTSW